MDLNLAVTKDLIQLIGSFLPVKWFKNLRKVCKQFYSWLSEANSLAWRERIQKSFPISFEAILKEEMKVQMSKLVKFDSLVEEGNQVSFFPWIDLTDEPRSTYQHFTQIPWSPHLFMICSYAKGLCFLFDSECGAVICKLACQIDKFVSFVFDLPNRRIGLLNRDLGNIKLFTIEDNSLKVDSEFTSEQLRSAELVGQIYGDVVVKIDGTKLLWYSLKSNSILKTVDFSSSDAGIFVAASQVEPVIYVAESIEESYSVWVVDADVNSENPKKMLYGRPMDVEMDNEGDGISRLWLQENDKGRLLKVDLSGSGEYASHAFDLKQNKKMPKGDYDCTVDHNAGTPFYTQDKRSVLAVFSREHLYENPRLSFVWFDRAERTRLLANMDTRLEDLQEAEPGSYFSFLARVHSSSWLNSDLLEVCTKRRVNGKQTLCQLFFSVNSRRVIGSIDDTVYVYMCGNQTVAVSLQGLYRITWKPELVQNF